MVFSYALGVSERQVGREDTRTLVATRDDDAVALSGRLQRDPGARYPHAPAAVGSLALHDAVRRPNN